MSKTALQEWLALSNEAKKTIFGKTADKLSLSDDIVEKDWWVVHTLGLIFQMDCASSLIFKGGTSLSKGWDLIQRFSEDIDLVLDREFLGFKGD
jgi:predicted nucleotidyltransferase component of viral defense system